MNITRFFGAPGPKYSLKKVILIVALSCLMISGSASIGYLIYRYTKQQTKRSASSLLQAIVHTTSQTGYERIHLEANFFAEILDLSADKPTYLGQFDIEKAKHKLLATHVIQNAHLKKMQPDILFIQYIARIPYVFLGDISNTAMDAAGHLFPVMPFYSPRQLPQLYLGLSEKEQTWGNVIEKEQLQRVQTLIDLLGIENIEYLDLSQAASLAAGRREIVVKFKGGCLLRLTPKNYVQQLANYSILKTTLLKQKRASIVDLRIPEVAYIQY